MKKLLLRSVGDDFWGRMVFQSVENGAFYKRYPRDTAYYTAESFEGEPEYPLRPEIVIEIVE
ncbi:hypothetical protein ABGV42_00420 [Paenibacillus pabuli]|uniref:hypothetical protein n=1 Tax=Paenibacillus pabuli TaxID=1472 RepID=UPI003241D2E1